MAPHCLQAKDQLSSWQRPRSFTMWPLPPFHSHPQRRKERTQEDCQLRDEGDKEPYVELLDNTGSQERATWGMIQARSARTEHEGPWSRRQENCEGSSRLAPLTGFSPSWLPTCTLSTSQFSLNPHSGHNCKWKISISCHK